MKEKTKNEEHLWEDEVRRINQVTSSRHLNLNDLLRQHLCGEDRDLEKTSAEEKQTYKGNKRGPVVSIVIALLLLSLLYSCDSPIDQPFGNTDSTSTEPQIEIPKGNLHPTYHWVYKGIWYEATFDFSQEDYEYYSAKPRSLEYSDFTGEDIGHRYIEAIGRQVYKSISQSRLTELETAECVLCMVQQGLHYQITNGPVYPIQALVLGYSDCRGMSLTYATILSVLGIRSVLVRIPGHLTNAVAAELPGKQPFCMYKGQYFYRAECTNPQWLISDIPEDPQEIASMEVYEVPQSTSIYINQYQHPPEIQNHLAPEVEEEMPCIGEGYVPSGGHVPGMEPPKRLFDKEYGIKYCNSKNKK